jgi:hypothetical protein
LNLLFILVDNWTQGEAEQDDKYIVGGTVALFIVKGGMPSATKGTLRPNLAQESKKEITLLQYREWLRSIRKSGVELKKRGVYPTIELAKNYRRRVNPDGSTPKGNKWL